MRGLQTGWDIWTLTMSEETQPLLQAPFNERDATFSPDGRFVAYTSDESGKEEVYVRPFPGPGPKVSISVGGGTAPRWSGNGDELFYSSPVEDREGTYAMVAVPISEVGSEFRAGQPHALFQYFNTNNDANQYDVSHDGRRFVLAKGETVQVDDIHVVKNWFEELRELVPAGNK